MAENNYTEIAFDITDWINELEIDNCVLVMQRPKDKDPYPAQCEIERDYYRQKAYAVHKITSTDLRDYGNGRCQLQMLSGDIVAKSPVYTTICLISLGDTAAPPAPWQSWLQTFAEYAARAEQAAEEAEEAVYEAFGQIAAEADQVPYGQAAAASFDTDTKTMHFDIPEGKEGPEGKQGIQGIPGKDGEDGAPGAPGSTGPRGLPGVVISETEPTDPDVSVWLDPTGGADVVGSVVATLKFQIIGGEATYKCDKTFAELSEASEKGMTILGVNQAITPNVMAIGSVHKASYIEWNFTTMDPERDGYVVALTFRLLPDERVIRSTLTIAPEIDDYLDTMSFNPVQNAVVAEAIANKQNVIADLGTIRAGAAKGATAVQPETGKGLFSGDYNDLINKPSAVESPVVYIPWGDLANTTGATMLSYINAGKTVLTISKLDATGRAQYTLEFLSRYTYDESATPKYHFIFSSSYGKVTRDEVSIYCHYFGLNNLETDKFTNGNLVWSGAMKPYLKPSTGIPASDIASGVIPTDAHINSLIDAKLGVIENGSY